MKTSERIHLKIETLMFIELPKAQEAGNKELEEKICNQIDALLWVIDDRSGAPLVGEHR